jgi:hypothetical protein
MARWQPPQEQVVQAPKPSRWPMIVLLLAVLGVAGAGLWMLYRRLHPRTSMDSPASAVDVRSNVSVVGDSLEIVVSWRLAEAPNGIVPDSVRLEVGMGNGSESRDHVTSSDRTTDTLRLPAPPPGKTASGYSCVAAVHGTRLSPESCTPWQYVRPAGQLRTAPESTSAKPSRKVARTEAHGPRIVRIIVEPEGQQVDPDVGGRCAAWQRRHPRSRVWVDVNREAVPECTGPNGKPTIAQFCAFAVLEDGRRVKTENSTNDLYCERLFQLWVRERMT